MFVLDHDGPVPLYTQLYNAIKDDILSGKLPSDTRLPSVRDLASELSISRNTVDTSYQELFSEGYIYSRPRSGYFVSALAPDGLLSPQPPKGRVAAPLPAAAPRFEIDFHPARLDRNAFPVPLWRKCLLECLRRSSSELIDYRDPQGEWGLRCHIQQYLERSRGVICQPEQVVICSGLQNGLDIVAQLMRERRPLVAVESPGYHLPRSVFRNHSFELAPIPVNATGMDLDLLASSRSTIAYVTPSHQFPMGCVMPIANRLKLIEWAKTGGRLIIEDDYDSELRYHGKPIPSLQGLHPGGNIVYSGTFSKVLSPALRVSYLILPHSLLDAYRKVFRDYFSSVSLLEQRTLAEFMEQGHWDRHIRRMRALYKKKHDAVLNAVEHHFGARAAVLGQGAGLHVVLQLNGHALSEGELIGRAREAGVGLLPFSMTHAAGEPDSLKFLLGFGGVGIGDIGRGIELLCKAWYCG
ncbi:PLP-dependent aminotransferase family protein [Geomonas sp. Red32]|uniref:MocR-like pyridoxine biosynthesis transcription factor PdxR n=1 Tax=Geomonas sp. Red32 TaxID=2912856 RepID=UPI00202CC62D|nr:PLP-dependent aminotransferase family protein [Geomonas sp. Red32]MCM0080484.1 PLP-dependent aminotransferase family protein [Geomonas sp. Red32]